MALGKYQGLGRGRCEASYKRVSGADKAEGSGAGVWGSTPDISGARINGKALG